MKRSRQPNSVQPNNEGINTIPFIFKRYQVFLTMSFGYKQIDCLFSILPKDVFQILLTLVIPNFILEEGKIPDYDDDDDWEDFERVIEDFPQDLFNKFTRVPDYFFVACGYVDRLKKFLLKQFPTHVPNGSERKAIESLLIKTGLSEDYQLKESVLFRGIPPLEELMGIEHCGSFNHSTLCDFKFLHEKDNFCIVVMVYDTESG